MIICVTGFSLTECELCEGKELSIFLNIGFPGLAQDLFILAAL